MVFRIALHELWVRDRSSDCALPSIRNLNIHQRIRSFTSHNNPCQQVIAQCFTQPSFPEPSSSKPTTRFYSPALIGLYFTQTQANKKHLETIRGRQPRCYSFDRRVKYVLSPPLHISQVDLSRPFVWYNSEP